MKRLLPVLLAILLVLSVAACSEQTSKPPLGDTPEAEVPSGDVPGDGVDFIGDEIYHETDENGNVIRKEMTEKYRTLEEALTQCTHVCKAKCVAVVERDYRTEYQFSVEECYLGSHTGQALYVVAENIDVTVWETDYCYNHRDVVYEVGESYYLLLRRKYGADEEGDRYVNGAGNLFLPVGEVDAATMYGTSLFEHTGLDATVSEAELLAYVTALLDERKS
ncbi:MAG: hypothetical protein J6L87_03655 [Clostridia bacterium]|nr:hypothetical protein [Clostridia bacterium]